MDESLAKLSLLQRHNGTDAAELDAIYECISADQSLLPKMVSQLANQNRATVRALWRYTEKQLETASDESKKLFLDDVVNACENEESKISTLSLVLSYGTKIFQIESSEKILPSVYDFVISIAKSSVSNIESLTHSGTLLKLLNQIMTKNSTDNQMFESIKASLFEELLQNVKQISFQRNVDYMSGKAIRSFLAWKIRQLFYNFA